MIDVISAAGSAYERGTQIGRTAGPRIAAHLADWLGSLRAASGEEGATWARALIADTDFKAALTAHAPDLLDEVRGVADGAGLDADLVFALQLLDEEWAYRLRRRSAAPRLSKCSSLAVVQEGGPTFIAQNMDLGVYTDTHQLAVRIAPGDDRPGALLFTLAGLIGLMGVNSAGVGVCVNSLPQLPSGPVGVPVAFMLRRLLQTRSLAEASALVQTLPHATNQHYLIAQCGAARSFECSAEGVVEHRPGDGSRLFHTNHPLGARPGAPETAAQRINSAARLQSLERRLRSGRVDLSTVKAALSSLDDPRNPVCRVYDTARGLTGFTTGSMIAALAPIHAPSGAPGPGALAVLMSAGPPAVAGYDALTLDLDP